MNFSRNINFFTITVLMIQSISKILKKMNFTNNPGFKFSYAIGKFYK